MLLGAVDLARGLIQQRAVLPDSMSGDRLRELAWALKDICYAAWSTEPQGAARAADTLALLVERSREEDTRRVVAALAQWTRGIAQLTRGEMNEAIASLDSARAAFVELEDTHSAAQTLVPRIMALAMLARHEEAIETAQAAQRELMVHGDDRGAAKVSLNLGSLHLRRDSFAQAAVDYRRSAVLFARVGDAEHSIMADIGLADALTAHGEFDEASRIYARAGMRAEAHRFPVLSAMQSESLALLDLARGNFAEALARMEQARRTYDRLSMPQHLAIAEKQLADGYLELKLVPEAIALLEQVRSRFETQEMHDDLAWTVAQLGRAYALTGENQRAIEALDHATRVFERQANAVGTASVALARAELALASRDALTACAYADSAARAFALSNLADRELRARSLQAHAMLETGALDEATHLFATLLDRAQALHVLPVQVSLLTGQGLIAAARGDREHARRAFERAVELFEQQRSALAADELRDAFLTDHLLPYRELVRMALDGWQAEPTPSAAARVLASMERFRARALGDRLRRRESFDDEDATRELRTRANWLRRRVTRIADEGGEVASALDELRQAELALLEHGRRERLVNARASGESSAFDDDLETLTRSFQSGDALVEYGVVGDELFACVATADGVRVRRGIASWREVQENLRSARFQIESLRHGSGPLASHLEVLVHRAQVRMRRLHHLVWAPLRDLLTGVRRVLVAPYGELGAMPFGALHDGAAYLVESLDIAVVPGACIAARTVLAHRGTIRQAVVMGVSREIPYARREAELVANAFTGTTLIMDDDATVQAFVDAAGKADLVHLACHAQFRSDNPMFSALHLADGALTAEHVERLHMGPATIVLSACETAAWRAGLGDEMFGLVRAFFVAGAARVVATLWPVDDAATADVMTAFHAALREHASPSAALRKTQRELMHRRPHPFHWAAFTVYGGW